MNLAQFLRHSDAEMFCREGIYFPTEEEAIELFKKLPPEAFPEQFGRVIIYEVTEYSSLPTSKWRSLLFLTSEQAELAQRRIDEQLQAPVGVRDNQLVFEYELDEAALYQAIASSVVEVIGYQVVVQPGIPDEDWTILGDFCWIPMEFKEDPLSPKPQILVRDSDAFESVKDRTVWIDAAQEPEAIVQMISWWLGQSPIEGASWWSVIDVVGFPPKFCPESYNNLEELSYVAKNWQEHGEGFWVYYLDTRFDRKAVSFDRVKYLGCYSSAREYFCTNYEELWNQGDFEPEFEDLEEFCDFHKALYTILYWQGNEYIYEVFQPT